MRSHLQSLPDHCLMSMENLVSLYRTIGLERISSQSPAEIQALLFLSQTPILPLLKNFSKTWKVVLRPHTFPGAFVFTLSVLMVRTLS